MSEIKVGEYVRTYDGSIGKLVKIIPNVLNNLKIDVKREIKHCDNSIDNYIYTRKGFIVKYSEQLVDLIEEGDFVEIDYYGGKVIETVIRDNNELCIGLIEHQPAYINLKDVEILSIVTKEIFEEMEYKL